MGFKSEMNSAERRQALQSIAIKHSEAIVDQLEKNEEGFPSVICGIPTTYITVAQVELTALIMAIAATVYGVEQSSSGSCDLFEMLIASVKHTMEVEVGKVISAHAKDRHAEKVST